MDDKMPLTQTIKVEYTDEKGNKSVQSHMVWDAEKFMSARFDECKKNIAENKDGIRAVRML